MLIVRDSAMKVVYSLFSENFSLLLLRTWATESLPQYQGREKYQTRVIQPHRLGFIAIEFKFKEVNKAFFGSKRYHCVTIADKVTNHIEV